jgi:hypothetical protein
VSSKNLNNALFGGGEVNVNLLLDRISPLGGSGKFSKAFSPGGGGGGWTAICSSLN